MKNLSLYIHIPFCRKKCFYCDFPSFDTYFDEDNIEKVHINYTNSLIMEIKSKGVVSKDFTINTIFFGGGTPTILSSDLLESILNEIKNCFNVSHTAEITIEANPATFDYDKALRLRKMGFNRISMGVQAWQNSLLKSLGRLHTIDEFIDNFHAVRKAGFQNVNVDLMFSLPNQDLAMWQETLHNIVDLSPEHISVYSLIIEEDTLFFKQLESGIIEEIDEDLDRSMYHYAIDYLADNGYTQYEISNFSKDDFICEHNMVYWSMTDYLGLGLSSHSYFNKQRFHNTYDLDDYIYCDDFSIENSYDLEITDEQNEISEYMFLGLRRNKGVSFDDFKNTFNKDIYDIYPNIIYELIEKGLLQKDDYRIYLTKKGIDLSNIVFSEFLL